MVSVESSSICEAANFSPFDTCTRIRYDRESVLQCIFWFYYYINGSNTFGAMKICSSQG